MKYTSTNIFSDFEFHDACFMLESIKDNMMENLSGNRYEGLYYA